MKASSRTKASPHAALARILAHLRSKPSRTWSLIITFYGDAIVPRSGSVWLGTLLEFFKALDVEEGVVRTAMSRLAADGWLERTKIGRNSFYHIADKGRETFRTATEHIYHAKPDAWRGRFELILLTADAEREPMRNRLEAQGYGQLNPGLFIAPAGRMAASGDHAVRLDATTDDLSSRRLAAMAWPLGPMADAYRVFIETFSGLDKAVTPKTAMSDIDALVARILLIHEYRRIILRDPLLPMALLPEDWPGATARRLCAGLYHKLLPASERWLDAKALTETGAPAKSAASLHRRFQAS